MTPQMLMADGNEPPNFGDMIFDSVQEAIKKETAGMTLPEAAAHFDTSLVFHELNDGAASMAAKTDDNTSVIIIDRNLRAKDQEKAFYHELTMLTLARRA